jgi:hypothetical protein
VVAKFRDRLVVCKTAKQNCVRRDKATELNAVEGRKQYDVIISNRPPDLENLDDDVDINRAWETILENIKSPSKEGLGYNELRQHKA